MQRSSIKKSGKIEKKRLKILVDYIYPLKSLKQKKYFIKDHVNLSGFNPLKGPAFISLTNIYYSKKGLIVAGLKEGASPNIHEKRKLLKAGVSAYCYNLVSAAILAASHGLRIKAIGIVKR